ncbi:MAG: biotin transporter BioY [Hominimerdicola sp.]
MYQAQKIQTKQIVLIGLFAAIIAILSQIALPLPINVPVTLQTFAVALCGYFLGRKNGSIAVIVYVILGAVGLPVFSGWKGGLSAIAGFTGGFIYGFIPMAFLCGQGMKLTRRIPAIVLGIAGLACTHLLGALQYSILAKISFGKSLMTVSLPFIVKDIVSVIFAYIISAEVQKRLGKSDLVKN